MQCWARAMPSMYVLIVYMHICIVHVALMLVVFTAAAAAAAHCHRLTCPRCRVSR
jgi:hypothetical protein